LAERKKEIKTAVSGNKIVVTGDYGGLGVLIEIAQTKFGSDVEIKIRETTNGAVITVTNKRRDTTHQIPPKRKK